MEKVIVSFKGENDEIKIDLNLNKETNTLDYEVVANPVTPSDKSKLVYFFATQFISIFKQTDDTSEDNTTIQDNSGK